MFYLTKDICRQMKQFLSRYGGCLLNLPLTKEPSWQLEPLHRPGEKPACKQLQGHLVQEHNYLKSPNAAALQGTWCAKGKHCYGGGCVMKTGTAESTQAGTSKSEPQATTLTTSVQQSPRDSPVFFPSRSMGIGHLSGF